MSDSFPITTVRKHFPALASNGRATPLVYFDNPAGTQVPRHVIDRMTETLTARNANLGGFFSTSRSAGALVKEAHEALADFYNAPSADEIVFGQNMTTITFHLSRCIGRQLKAGDEIVLTRMDHDANIAPWLLLADEKGLEVRWLDFNPETYEFDDNAIEEVLSGRPRLLAVCHASNVTGTLNDIPAIVRKAKAAGALTYVDAVQSAPHVRIDVASLGADILVTSPYKWFGPHQGVLWGRTDVLESIFPYKVRPAGEGLPDKFELGTLSHESMAGCLGAVEYIAEIGASPAARSYRPVGTAGRRRDISAAFGLFVEHERALTRRLLQDLADIRGLTVRGVTGDNRMDRRVPTVSFTVDGHHPDAIAKALADRSIFVWSGHNYGFEPVKRLGLLDGGGVLRVGLAHYNTFDEVERFGAALREVLGR